MSRVRIVGGGLTGILAAFEAHRLGARDIELHERFDRLGGAALPVVRHGLEMREACLHFGPPGDPVRHALETHGLAFDDFDSRFGSVSPGRWGEPLFTEDFGGPVLAAGDITLTAPAGASLAQRLAAYPVEVHSPLARYARWHLGEVLGEIHESAVLPMAAGRVYPLGADLAALADAKRRSPLADDLYAIPRTVWGPADALTASLPRDGFPAFFRAAGQALEGLGVVVRADSLVSPRHALAEHRPGENLVWAADPTPLFKAAGLPTPKRFSRSFTTYVFKARWTGALPFHVHNFTAQGVCFRAFVYDSGGQALLAAECVDEASDSDLRRELCGLMAGFPGDLALGELAAVSVKPRWAYPSLESISGLAALRAALADRMGPAFVAGAWEAHARADRFAQVSGALACALRGGRAVAAA